MKRVFLVLAVVLALTSCAKIEIEVDGETGGFTLVPIVEQGSDEDLKSSINRDNEPVYVKGLGIDILEGSTLLTSQTVMYVDDNSGEDRILIEDVSLTADKIEVSSIPAIDCNLPIKFFGLDDQNLVDNEGSSSCRTALLDHIKGLYGVNELVPYAEYYGEADIDMNAGNSNVSVLLDTEYGRDFGTVINTSDYTVKVVMSVVGQGVLGHVSKYTHTFEPHSTEAIGYYWGNEYATEGTQGIKFQYTWYDAHGKTVKTDNRWRVISKAKQSYWARITVGNSDIKDETLHSSFEFLEIEEVGGNYDI